MIIDLGAGPSPTEDSTVRVDKVQWSSDITHIHDLEEFPYPCPSDVADKIYIRDVLEHLICFNVPKVLDECYRILKPKGIIEITCPDVLWIMQRIVHNDWEEMANVHWLRKEDDPWDNAMDYLFGGWRHPTECHIEGMGHINGFCENSLAKLLEEAGFINIERIKDDRNPEPACWAVLRMIGTK